MRAALLALFVCFSSSMFAQCQFSAEPIANTTWYRSEGWRPPAIRDGRATRSFNVTINGKPPAWPAGVSVSEIVHRKGYRVTFPAAIFEENGTREKMRSRTLVLGELLRWDISGKPYAYSYELVPNGVACMFSVDLLDDKGDGIFRVMVSPGHTRFDPRFGPPPLPALVKPIPHAGLGFLLSARSQNASSAMGN